MKKLIGLLLFLFLFFSENKISFAQGTYTCEWIPPSICAPTRATTTQCEGLGTQTMVDPLRCAGADTEAECEAKGPFECIPLQDIEELEPVVEKEESFNQSFKDLFCSDFKSLDTAIGCIPFEDTNAFVGFLLRWAIGIGGGIAFLLILYAGFMIMTSTGNPDRLKAGRELLTSAITGLLLLIFSVFVLRIIGVEILQIPGFGG